MIRQTRPFVSAKLFFIAGNAQIPVSAKNGSENAIRLINQPKSGNMIKTRIIGRNIGADDSEPTPTIKKTIGSIQTNNPPNRKKP